jgi:hypothetical protein
MLYVFFWAYKIQTPGNYPEENTQLHDGLYGTHTNMKHRYVGHIWGTELLETDLNGTQIGQPHLGDKNPRVLRVSFF